MSITFFGDAEAKICFIEHPVSPGASHNGRKPVTQGHHSGSGRGPAEMLLQQAQMVDGLNQWLRQLNDRYREVIERALV